jgi:type II secretory pathway component PulF
MFFSQWLSAAVLVEHCRALRHQTDAGLSLAKAMRQQGQRGPRAVQPVASRVARRLENGDSLAEALADETQYYPPLFLSIAHVAEESGKLPEALGDLEKYFELQVQLWRNFVKQITWPVVQLLLALLVISLTIYILGLIPNNETITVFGLKGEGGVAVFLLTVFGVLIALVAAYWFVRQVLRAGGAVDRFLLRIPYLGGCLQALALARFSLSMALLVEAGVRIDEAVRQSLQATANDAFRERITPTVAALKGGESLTEVLEQQHVFPREFIDIVETGEVSGREPAIFHKLAEQQYELAEQRMRVLAQVAARLVWLVVAIVIIVMIANLVSQYLGALWGTMRQLGI